LVVLLLVILQFPRHSNGAGDTGLEPGVLGIEPLLKHHPQNASELQRWVT
jgi:hypothetical protein